MPNDLTGNPWKVVEISENPLSNHFVMIHGISWEGYADMNHHVMLKDGRGVPVFETYGNQDLSPISKFFYAPTPVWRPNLEDLGSGRLLLYV